MPDAIVVGSGPNGLAAAVTLARAGLEVLVYEGAESPGGGCRTAELTLPGFHHDVCSSVHPLLLASPFFDGIDLRGRGVRLCQPEVAFAHPIDGGRAAAVVSSVEETAATLGADAARYRRLLGPLVRDVPSIVPTVLSPMRSVPSRPLAMARFGARGVLPVSVMVRGFATDEGRALLAGAAAHAMRPMTGALTGAFALLFSMLAHAVGWPVVEGGSGRVVEALVGELESLGGRVVNGSRVRDMAELPPSRATLLDISPDQLLTLAGDRLPPGYRRQLRRYRYGPGVCKVDWALSGPVPWSAPACRQAGTLHVCGTFEEVARSER